MCWKPDAVTASGCCISGADPAAGIFASPRDTRGGMQSVPSFRLQSRRVDPVPSLVSLLIEFLEQTRHRRVARHQGVASVGLLVELVVEVAADHVERDLLGGTHGSLIVAQDRLCVGSRRLHPPLIWL